MFPCNNVIFSSLGFLNFGFLVFLPLSPTKNLAMLHFFTSWYTNQFHILTCTWISLVSQNSFHLNLKLFKHPFFSFTNHFFHFLFYWRDIESIKLLHVKSFKINSVTFKSVIISTYISCGKTSLKQQMILQIWNLTKIEQNNVKTILKPNKMQQDDVKRYY